METTWTYYHFLLPALAILLTLTLLLKIKKSLDVSASSEQPDSILPGPAPLPLIGNLHQLSSRPFLEFTKLSHQYGPVFKVRLGSWDAVVLNNEAALKEAFVSHAVAFSGRVPFASMKHINGGSSYIFNSYSEKWKLQKKALVRAVEGVCKTASLETVISDMADCLVKDLIKVSPKPVEPIALIKWQQTRLMVTLVFGPAEDSDVRTQEVETLTQTLEQFMANISKFVPFDFFPGVLTLLPYVRRCMKQACLSLYDAITPLIQRAETVAPSSDSAIHFLLESQREQDSLLSKDEVLRLADDMLGAGLDTTTSLLSWMVLYLARYREMQAGVRREIQTLLCDEVTWAMRDSLPYSQSCILEIARHSAVMPFTIPHYTLSQTQLCGYNIPQGTVVFGNMHALCHDPQLWASPEEFVPDRFLTEDGAGLDNAKINQMYMYSLGKRRCIGDVIAKLELFLTFTRLVQSCEIAEDPEHPLPIGQGHFEVTHRPVNYKVKVTASH